MALPAHVLGRIVITAICRQLMACCGELAPPLGAGGAVPSTGAEFGNMVPVFMDRPFSVGGDAFMLLVIAGWWFDSKMRSGLAGRESGLWRRPVDPDDLEISSPAPVR